jgi:superfamily II DNA or RNA helicase
MNKTPQLRPHQQEVLDKWNEHTGNRALLFMPVGSGKTYTSLAMLQARGITKATLVGIIATFPKWKADAEKYDITLECVSHQMFAKTYYKPKHHDLILDECHKLIGNSVNKMALKHTKDLSKTVLSLSATPNWNSGFRWYNVLQTLWYRPGGYINWLYGNCNVKANPFSRLPDFVDFKLGLDEFLKSYPFIHRIIEDDDYEIKDIEFTRTSNPQYDKVKTYSLLDCQSGSKVMGSVMEKLQVLNTLQYCDIDLSDDEKYLANLREDLTKWLKEQPKSLIYCNKAKMGELVAATLDCLIITGKTNKKLIPTIVNQFGHKDNHLVVTDVMATGYDEFPGITDSLIIFQDTNDNKQREQLIGRINRGKNKGKANICRVAFEK